MRPKNVPAQAPDGEDLIGGIRGAFRRPPAITEVPLVDCTRMARKAGLRFPMFLTRAVFNTCVAVPEGVLGQHEGSRLWEVVRMTRLAILRSRGHPGRLTIGLYVRNDNCTLRLVKLIAVCSAFALDDSQPVITVMTVDEDRRR